MKKSHLTNEQMAALMKELQSFWKEWRDCVDDSQETWNKIIFQANGIYDRIGDGSEDMIACFINQLSLRVPKEGGESE